MADDLCLLYLYSHTMKENTMGKFAIAAAAAATTVALGVVIARVQRSMIHRSVDRVLSKISPEDMQRVLKSKAAVQAA